MTGRSLLLALALVAVLALPGAVTLLAAHERATLAVAARALPTPPVPGTTDGTDSSSPVRLQVAPEWVDRTAQRAGIPPVAVRAYATAQLLSSCRAGWTTVAAIGWVESQHGGFGGRTLRADGRSSTPVIGPALDGRGAVAAIASSPSSARWHGDRVWEHAVGPMQFLPSTWRGWTADGDGDGSRDPFDLDDAALAAAEYLCASGDLTTPSGWAEAVWAYNHDSRYVDQVHAVAVTYSERAGE